MFTKMLGKLRNRWSHNPYIGLFSGWSFTKYAATSPCANYKLWIGNGPSSLKDAGLITLGIDALPYFEKRKIYKALLLEKAKRNKKKIGSRDTIIATLKDLNGEDVL